MKQKGEDIGELFLHIHDYKQRGQDEGQVETHTDRVLTLSTEFVLF